LIKVSWGEAAVASLNGYCEAHPAAPLPSVTSVSASAAFHRAVAKLKPADFSNGEPDVATIRTAVAAARRALLPEGDLAALGGGAPEATLSEKAVCDQICELNTALIESVLTTVGKELGDDDQPLPQDQDLRDFLGGRDGAESIPSLLDQLSIHVAYYLKTNPRAQTAVLHHTLQQISDRQESSSEEIQKRLGEFCDSVRATQSDLQRNLIDSFNKEQAEAAERITRHIDQAFNNFAQPNLDRPFDSPSDSEDFRFTFRSRRTAMVGREAAVDALLQFMGDARAGCWTVISGPAGSGKSRLAAELIAMVRDPEASYAAGAPAGQWRAGFLRSGDNWLKSKADNWTADADTLIVIDYAGEADERRLADLLAHLNEASDPAFLSQVRVVLIDRLAPDSPRGLSTRLLSGRDAGGRISANRWSSRSEVLRAVSASSGGLAEDVPLRIESSGTNYRDPRALDPVSERDALEIVRDWASRQLSNPQREQIQRAIATEPELARPLFAALMGDAISHDALPPGALSPVSVASSALKRLFKEEAQLPECAQCSSQTQAMLAAVTASQGLSEEDVFDNEKALSDLTGRVCPGGEGLRLLKRCLSQFSTYSENRFGPLEPDFLGGLFVLESLSHEATYQRALARAKLLMSFAWTYGDAPWAFLVRLAADFVGRADQLNCSMKQDCEWLSPARIDDLLVTFILSGLGPEAARRGGPDAVGYAIYFASRADVPRVAYRLMSALESAFSKAEAEIEPLVLAQAWFGLACSGDLPESAGSRAEEAIDRIGELLARHDTAEIALAQAWALMNATAVEPDPGRREALADRIGELLARHDTAEVALAQARALYNATAVEPDPVRCEALADRIGELLARHDTAEIALEQAKAFYNATAGEPGPVRCEALADRIGELLGRHDTAEVALARAKAFYNATVAEPDSGRCKALADRIGELLARQDTAEIALEQAKALMVSIAREPEPSRQEALAYRIDELAEKHESVRNAIVALAAKASGNAEL
jgi:RecA/RadA recombinase